MSRISKMINFRKKRDFFFHSCVHHALCQRPLHQCVYCQLYFSCTIATKTATLKWNLIILIYLFSYLLTSYAANNGGNCKYLLILPILCICEKPKILQIVYCASIYIVKDTWLPSPTLFQILNSNQSILL